MPLLGLLLLGVAGMNRFAMAMDPQSAFGQSIEIVSQDEEKHISLSEAGISLLLEPNARVSFRSQSQALQIVMGTALIAEAGLASVDSGFGAEATQFMGSMMVLRDQASSTIVALLSPLVVTVAGKTQIIPPGYQLRVDASGSVQRSEVPTEWFAQQLSRSPTLPVAALSSEAISKQSLLAQLFKSEDLSIRLIAAFNLALLADQTDLEAVDHALLSETLRSLGTPELVFGIPALARSVLRPLPSSLIDLWVQAATTSAASAPALTASILHEFLPSIPLSYEAAGYPKQAILWRDAVSKVNVVLSPLFSRADGEHFASDTEDALHDRPPELAPVLSNQILSASRNFLLSKHVLFTATTAFAADEQLQGCIRVSDIYLEYDPDHSYAFSLCMEEQMIRRIIRDSKLLPNDVPFQKFFL